MPDKSVKGRGRLGLLVHGRCRMLLGFRRLGRKGSAMQKDVLLEIVKQNQVTSHFSFDRVTEENANLRLK